MSLDFWILSVLLLKLATGEAPAGETVAIVPELDTSNAGGVYSASSAYSNYQPTSVQSGYTTPTVTPYTTKTGYYPSSRPYSVSSTYLPVIPVSTSYYTLATSPTTSPDYSVWAPRPSPVYGVPQPTWAAQPWAAARAWPATQAWASGIQPWAGQPWTAQPWSAASPWPGIATYGAPGYNYDNPNIVGIKPPL